MKAHRHEQALNNGGTEYCGVCFKNPWAIIRQQDDEIARLAGLVQTFRDATELRQRRTHALDHKDIAFELCFDCEDTRKLLEAKR